MLKSIKQEVVQFVLVALLALMMATTAVGVFVNNSVVDNDASSALVLDSDGFTQIACGGSNGEGGDC